MSEVSFEELGGVSATVGAIQRIAMAMVELPREERMAHYTGVRTNLAAAIKELGIKDTIANAWLDKTMHVYGRSSWKFRRVVAHSKPAARWSDS